MTAYTPSSHTHPHVARYGAAHNLTNPQLMQGIESEFLFHFTQTIYVQNSNSHKVHDNRSANKNY